MNYQPLRLTIGQNCELISQETFADGSIIQCVRLPNGGEDFIMFVAEAPYKVTVMKCNDDEL